MIGFHFTKYDPAQNGKSRFDQLLDLFTQLLTYTSGDVTEALQWLNQLDKKYELTHDEYGMGDFIDDLKEKGFNTVLLNHRKLRDDGSLPFYCSKNNKSFVHIATLPGHKEEQRKMLEALDGFLK